MSAGGKIPYLVGDAMADRKGPNTLAEADRLLRRQTEALEGRYGQVQPDA